MGFSNQTSTNKSIGNDKEVSRLKDEINKLGVVLEEHQAKVDAIKKEKDAVMGVTVKAKDKQKELDDMATILAEQKAKFEELTAESIRLQKMNDNLRAEIDKHG